LVTLPDIFASIEHTNFVIRLLTTYQQCFDQLTQSIYYRYKLSMTSEVIEEFRENRLEEIQLLINKFQNIGISMKKLANEL
jgi:hypothetical protein